MLNEARMTLEDLSPQTAPSVVFDAFAAEGILAFQECPECSRAVFPPRVLCPRCGSGTLEWKSSTGIGTVYSCTTISPRDGQPYTVALIDLAEGYRMMSTVTDPLGEPVSIGDRVAVEFSSAGETVLPIFVTAMP
ncbi:OB-fold domain-containing protein [Microbacterium profundi]|uniref:OB-fold domain-containing protein n=1 Tax=Microbacterium profundi TaxID=450380 RepID=A0ABV3LD59_9MICO